MTIEELRKLIIKVSGKPVTSLVETQIMRFSQEGYTYKELGRCIWYFFIILGNDPTKIEQYGIGIVPRIRDDANRYYDNIKEQQEKQKIAAERVKNQQLQEVEINPYRRVFHKKKVEIDGL